MDPVEIVTASVRSIAEGFFAALPQIITGIIIVIATWVLARVVPGFAGRVFKRIKLRRSLVELFRQLIGIAIWILGLLLAAVVIVPSFKFGNVVAGLGIGSLAIGFAFQDIFENFIAGVLLLLREPFQLGDMIEVQGMEGFVEEITIRDTYVRTVDGQRIVIPNAILFKNAVTVRTAQDYRRVTVMCGIAYGEDVDAARSVIRTAVERVASVSNDRSVDIFAQEFGESSIDFEVTWWTGSHPRAVRESRDEVIAAVKRALDDAGIEIPFPYRTLTFKEALPLEIPIRRPQEANGEG